MAQMLKNRFVHARNGLDFSRSLFPYEKRHSTNLLAGAIVPVHTQFLYPGMSPDFDFGCVIESAPLISTNLDNIYADVVCVWSPVRLVMTDWNEFLGESHTQAFTINRNITIPKVPGVRNNVMTDIVSGQTISVTRTYWADRYLAGHLGCRYHGIFDPQYTLTSGTPSLNPGSIFWKGVSVLPSRIYENNWNTFFRNENVQAPILIDKTSVYGTHDQTYINGLGKIQFANKLKNFYTVATPAPSLLDVSLSLGDKMPVIGDTVGHSLGSVGIKFGNTDALSWVNADLGVDSSGKLSGMSDTGFSNANNVTYSNMVTDLATLTVNKMYYALMEQRFANKMMKGRRAVEFYKNFFGIETSEAAHDLPHLICQKRFPLNVSQVIATANSSDLQGNTQTLGARGAYSVTGFGAPLIKNFLATEHGYLQTYLIIRGQPSLSSGIDKHLGYDSLLDTYLPEFDHIGPVGIEKLEIADAQAPTYNFGFTNAWYSERKQVSDVVGIMEPDEPLGYKTLSLSYLNSGTVISDSFLRFVPTIMDRIFQFKVTGMGTPNTSYTGDDSSDYAYDEFGICTEYSRYQFLTQFVVKGNLAAVMSPDSEPLQMRL